tara:strand:+ start:11222 stop:11566 length:345 start_codon:yes stop_codon:yes gene_type:complete
MEHSCVFCKIGIGDIPSDFVYSDEFFFVIRDINPVSPTHLLVIPQQHVTVLGGLKTFGRNSFIDMVEIANYVAEKEGIMESGFRLVINQGRDSGQEIEHLHMHVLGGHSLGAIG